jgi:hypothetical protein
MTAGNCRAGAKCPFSMTVSGAFVLFASSRIVLPNAAASAAMGVMGTYTKLAMLTQSGWPVYQHVGSTSNVHYLFFWPAFQRWLIGPDYTTGLSSVQSGGGFTFGEEQVRYAGSSSNAAPVASGSASSAVCPDEASDWVLFDGEGGWISTYPITVREGAPGPSTRGPNRRGRVHLGTSVRAPALHCFPSARFLG